MWAGWESLYASWIAAGVIGLVGVMIGLIARRAILKSDGKLRWIRHALDRYVGHRFHIEFTPADGKELEDPALHGVEAVMVCVEHGARIFAQPTCHHRPEVVGGLRERDAAQLLQDFFRARR